ncbi:TPA: acylphosphatase [Candidatus Micrarchaeota archaeon]|nr:acylphosphatase [Candidatus Micrarchaeota archaeon]HIH30188.1 acylphosphatase [Candidatus Micrarchaeota archaeon]
MLHLKLIAKGNVQGVGFRAFVIRIGSSLNLLGCAKNLPDGSVEIIAEGTKEKLGEFLRRIKFREPNGISVEFLETVEEKEISKPLFASFSVAY